MKRIYCGSVFLGFLMTLVGPFALADPVVTEADRLVSVVCQSVGTFGSIDYFEQPESAGTGPFVEAFDFDCSNQCQVLPDLLDFDCKSSVGLDSTISPWFYEAHGTAQWESTSTCGGCTAQSVPIYETRFDTDLPYRMVFSGSSTSADVLLVRTSGLGATLVRRYPADSGPFSFDGVVEAGSYRLWATTNPTQGVYDFTLTISSPATAGPPPVPDGASVAGQPLRVVAENGGSVDLTWDATACGGGEVNVYYGSFGDFSTFTGGSCGLPSSGTATVAVPDNSWFLVVNTDGLGTDGSWSRDVGGGELNYGGAQAACPAIVAHQSNGACP